MNRTDEAAQTATIRANMRSSLLKHLDRIGLSPDGVETMLDNVQASHVRQMIAGRRAVPVDLLTALADLEPIV